MMNVTATVRPKRVAFLINPDTFAPEEIDHLVQGCSNFWGGAHWPIVPTIGDEVSDDWWSVLEAVDPDVIYSICRLTDAVYDQIHQRLAPAELVEMGPPEECRLRGLVRVDLSRVQALEANDVASFHARRRALLPDTRFLYLKDSPSAATDRSFVLRNFGLIQATVSTDLVFETLEHDEVRVSETSKTDVLERFINFHGQLVTPRDLGRLHAPRPFRPDYDHHSRAFHLVVGDTIEDILYAWNRTLTSDNQAGRDVLWLDGASAREPEFVGLVAEWIKRVFWDSQQRRGLILSYSEDLEFLEDVATVIREVGWLPCNTLRLDRGRFPFKASESVRRMHYPSFLDDPTSFTERIALRDGEGLLEVPRPPFLGSPRSGQGWMLDLDLEYQLDPPRYSNRQDVWRLPRRSTLGRLFSKRGAQTRIVRSGLPSIAVDSAERSIPILQPTKRAILWSLLEPIPNAQGRKDGTDQPRRRYSDFQTSEQGRRFRGVVKLFGGVGHAGRFFESDFWRAMFLEAAGKPEDDVESRTTRILDVARGATGNSVPEEAGPELTGSPGVLDPAVARKIATALHQTEARPKPLTSQNLSSRFAELMNRKMITTEKGERPLKFRDGAVDELSWLLDIGVLLQGATLTCPFCGIKQWRIVDELATDMRCPECTGHFRLPVEPIWAFQLNGLVRSALLRDGVLPLLHAVHDLTGMARHMALVIAPQDLRTEYDGPVETDLDVIVLCDGRFVIGEVKSDPARFNAKQMAGLTRVAQELRPDAVLLAAVGSSWPASVRECIEKMESQLAEQSIEVTARLMEW